MSQTLAGRSFISLNGIDFSIWIELLRDCKDIGWIPRLSLHTYGNFDFFLISPFSHAENIREVCLILVWHIRTANVDRLRHDVSKKEKYVVIWWWSFFVIKMGLYFTEQQLVLLAETINGIKLYVPCSCIIIIDCKYKYLNRGFTYRLCVYSWCIKIALSSVTY